MSGRNPLKFLTLLHFSSFCVCVCVCVCVRFFAEKWADMLEIRYLFIGTNEMLTEGYH
jgi:hypothetical protein